MELKGLSEIKRIINPKKSLKALLTVWFLLFSIVPISFLTGYSLVTFEKVYTDELLKRLNDNFIVISKSFEELNSYLRSTIDLHSSDDELIFMTSTKNVLGLKKTIPELIKGTTLSEMNIFDVDGGLIVSFNRVEENKIVNNPKAERGDIFLTETLMMELSENEKLILSDISPTGFDIIGYSTVIGRKGKIEGYIQEIIKINTDHILKLKQKFSLDISILDKDYRVIASTIPEFIDAQSQAFKKGSGDKIKFLDVPTNQDSFSVLIKPYNNQETIRIGLATSRKDINTTLKNIRSTVFKVVAIVILFIVLVLAFVFLRVLRPLNYLMDAVKKLEIGENVSYIPSEGETEVGVLTKSFNEMSRKITKVQSELTSKVKELEATNRELQDAQAQLVHTAKMGSLGQIVAGVAHELNNPIAFIYSNMEVLKDYTDRIIKVIDIAEVDPKNLHEAKKEADLDYVLEDLPRLIQSCEDGARRVRDIVMNLKTFSRSDEKERKEFDIVEGLESTLQILKSEYKDRIKVNKNFSQVPKVHCYASQINQVFMNILTNAIQAIEGKGEINISVQKVGLELMVSIKDSGKGIPQNIQEKIFDPFFTTKPVGEGTGLGLSISYGIIEKHGGRIELSSQEGKGTEFRIFLPIVTPR